jgi:hypothetical protein
MHVAASVVLDHQLSREIGRLQDPEALQSMQDAVERGAIWGYKPERERLQRELAEELRKVLQELRSEVDLAFLTARASRLLDAAALVGAKLDLWQTQNLLLETYSRLADSGSLTPVLHQTFARLAERLNISEGLLGWRP